jgi:hypothetical protein
MLRNTPDWLEQREVKAAGRRKVRRKPNHDKFNLNVKTVQLITAAIADYITQSCSRDNFEEILVF